jgi:YD repeat-containing protein
MLQRMTSATNPESGTVTYGYDLNSNLTSRTDARNITTSYSYDALNRLKTATYNDGVTPGVTYAYDTATNGKGLLASITSSAATDAIASYDTRGNVTGSSQTIGTNTYNFSYAYNLANALTSTTYPSGRVVANTYDGANRVSTVASGSTTYLSGTCSSGVCYAAFGGLAGHSYGNGLARTYSYNSLLQPSEIKDTGGGYTLLDNVLNWTSGNNNGNLPGQTVTHNGPNFSGNPLIFSPSYGYDALNRLTSATEGSNWSQSFGYDQYGNMWLTGGSESLPGNLMPTAQNAYNSATNQLAAASYDAAGNQQSYSTYAMTYDAENRQTQVYDNASGSTFTYGYNGVGTRVSKTVEGVTTQYAHDAFGNLAAEYSTAGPQDVQCKDVLFELGPLRLDAAGDGQLGKRDCAARLFAVRARDTRRRCRAHLAMGCR